MNAALMVSGTSREHTAPPAPTNTGAGRAVNPVSPTQNPVLHDHADTGKPACLQGVDGADACNDLHRLFGPPHRFGSSSGAVAPETQEAAA